ncbi:hypothetical protein [Flavobacterium sp. 1355]|uniref:P-loop NTPase n=1 Tax=Flavobacterium sp. 1355 TaxID=2806571 RepID=UPI001AEA3637|nr:hypothetical protein [Flavobacterium sp. 1355]MBP1223909.1 hypothetical protein [Flavobacterium sp. 1355]
MASKIEEKTNDLIIHVLNAFKHAKLQNDSALPYIRKGCEAMCKIIILKQKGDIDGFKIINGNIKNTDFSINSNPKSLDLFTLIDTCKIHRWFSRKIKSNDNLYHKFEDLRAYTNKGSHDNTYQESITNPHDIEFCLVVLKKILIWFWKEKLILDLPQSIISVIDSLEINDETLIQDNNWSYITDICDNFSSTTQNFLISPSNFKDLSQEQLIILSKINWNIIFDFDINSKNDGLFNAFVGNVTRSLRPITIEQINQKNIVSSSKHSTNWFFASGISDISTSLVSNYKEWRTKKYITLLEQIIEEFINQSSQSKLNVIILYDEVHYIEKIVEVISDRYPEKLLNIIILTDDEDKFYSLTEKFDNIIISNFSIINFLQSINSSIESKNLDIKSIQIPAKKDDNDIFIDIKDYYLSFLDKDIEILHKSIHNLVTDDEDSLSFYKGGVIQWDELANEIEVRRDIEKEAFDKVETYLNKQSSKGPIIELFHNPGSGGTTLSRKIAFNLKDKYPVVLINSYKRSVTSQGLFNLSELTKKPILAVVESHNVNVNDLNSLIRENNAAKKHIVYLYLQRYYNKTLTSKSKPSEVYLKDSMATIDERDRFVNKFSLNIPTREKYVALLKNNQPSECEVIDFSLTAFEDEFSKDKIKDYIKTYLYEIPQNQKEFIVYTCLYYYYTQSSTSEFWFYKKFINNSLAKELNYNAIINKLLIRERDDSGDYNGFWRPRFNQFAKLIIGVSLDTSESGNWKEFLSEWSNKFINDCRESNEFLIDEVRIAFKKMFLLRNNEDVIGLDNIDDNVQNNKFSQLINDVKDSNQQKLIFQNLTKSYPNEAHYRAHFGRFLFEKQESQEDLDLAKVEISEAIYLGQNDYNLWHLKGMCNRKTIEFKLNNSYNLDTSDFESFFHWLKSETEEAQNYFTSSKEIRSDNLHCHTAEIQMLIKVINFAKEKLYPTASINTFLTSRENIWYENQLNKILELIEEANYIIELSTDMDNAKHMNKARNMIEDGEAKTFKLLGDITKSIDKYKKLSESGHNSSRPYFRKMFVTSTLASKVNGDMKKLKFAWTLISEYERREILKVIESNIHDQPDVSSNYRIWLQCIRYNSVFVSLEDVINKIKIWYDNSGQNRISHLEATYYNYVFNAIALIERGEALNEIQLNKAIGYIQECKEITTNDKFNFEWYGVGTGSKKILNYVELGSMKNEGSKLFEDDSKLQEVEGTIITIDDRQKGRIKLKCGLEAFFVPIVGKFEKGKDETTNVKFYVSFRYDGLQAWSVKRLEKEKIEVSKESKNDRIFQNDSKLSGKIKSNTIKLDANIEKETLKSNFPQLPKPKVVGIVDLSKFKKRPSKN